MSDDKYCTNCGAKLEPGTQYCTSCGASVEAMENGTTQPYGYGPAAGGFDYVKYNMKQKLTTYFVLTAVYGVLAILFGLYFLCDTASVSNTYEEMYSISISNSILILVGALCVVSGFAAFAAALLVRRAQMFGVTIALYLIASLTSITFLSIVSLIIGLLMTYFVFKCKPAFAN